MGVWGCGSMGVWGCGRMGVWGAGFYVQKVSFTEDVDILMEKVGNNTKRIGHTDG